MIRNFFKYTIALLLIISTGGPVFSQSLNTAKLDSFFNVLSANKIVMGSFAIAKNGKIVYSRSIGYINENKPATRNSLYRIGSISKMFTATMIFQLIDEGKLSLTTTLDKYFPQIPNAKQITIEMLLDHRSGLFDFNDDIPDKRWITKPHTKNEILNEIINGKEHFAPNSNFSYSNSGYLLLAYIIENITGHSYNENLQKRICLKIGLKNTYSPVNNELKKNEAASYSFTTKWEKITDIYFPNVTGVGDILSTPADLISFDEALLNGKLTSLASLQSMKTFKDKTFGMGLMRILFDKYTGYGHAGDTYGTHSVVADFTSDQLVIAFSINGEVYPRNDVLIAMLSICYNIKYEIPSFKNIETLHKYTGIYSSTQLPLKITVTDNGTVLLIQLTGQSALVIIPAENNIFKNDEVGVMVEFNAGKNEMTVKQGGKSYLFTKDK